jgi:hypothetical protein
MLRRMPLAWGALTLACSGNTLNMGADEGDHWSDASEVTAGASERIYEGRSRIVAFTVDEENLYALTQSDGGERLQLQSCPTERCASERATLFDVRLPSASVINGTLHL